MCINSALFVEETNCQLVACCPFDFSAPLVVVVVSSVSTDRLLISDTQPSLESFIDNDELGEIIMILVIISDRHL